jgi:hypothetical protein
LRAAIRGEQLSVAAAAVITRLPEFPAHLRRKLTEAELGEIDRFVKRPRHMNLTAITKRIEALEERREAEMPRRKVVRRIIDDGKVVGGYAGEITPDMFVINRVIIDPPARRPSD